MTGTINLAPWDRNPVSGKLEAKYTPPPVGKTITITAIGGQNFGGGPNVVLFDQFIGNNLSPAFRVPDHGTWDNVSSYTTGVPRLYYDSTTDRTWLSGRDPTKLSENSWHMCALFKSLGNVTEFRFSHRAWVPIGKNFPAALTPGTMPTASSWKMSWLGKSNGSKTDLIGTGIPDRQVCIPTHIGTGTIAVDGNSNAPEWNDNGTIKKIYGNFSFTKPTLYSFYQDGVGVEGQYTSTCEFLSINDTSNAFFTQDTCNPLNGTDASFNTRDYDGFRFPGWFGNTSDWTDTVPLNADVYVAVGANSRASLFVSNAPTRAASTEIYHCLPNNWTNSGVATSISNHNDFGDNTFFHIETSTGVWYENVSFTRS